VLSWLIYPLSFVLTLGIVVTVHEFGHFWAARFFGVKVIRFAIGFGKPLIKWYDRKGTEFCICALPLGGYVRLLDSRQDEVSVHEMHEEFSSQKAFARILVYSAGPLINIILAVLVLWCYAMLGVTEVRPITGEFIKGSPAAQVAMQPREEIIAVDGQPIASWNDFNMVLIEAAGRDGFVEITTQELPQSMFISDLVPNSSQQRVNPKTQNFTKTSYKLPVSDFLSGVPKPFESLGIKPYRQPVPAILGTIIAGGAGEQANWRTKDKIVKLNNEDVASWQDTVRIIQANPNETISFRLERNSKIISGSIKPSSTATESGQLIGKVGVGVQEFEVNPELIKTTRYTILNGLVYGVEHTLSLTKLVFVSFGKLLVGALSLDNLSGPVTIAEIAGKSLQVGVSSFLSFLAYLSVSLGVVNILPIPMLDGGHILYTVIEIIRGKPLSEKIQQKGIAVGFALMTSVMLLAFYNDIARLLF